ncbi:MAG: tetratricopeptide repeat protein [Massilia sp.]
MKNAFAIVTLAGLLTACTTPASQAPTAPIAKSSAAPEGAPGGVPPPPASASARGMDWSVERTTPDSTAGVDEDGNKVEPSQPLPNATLTSELLYKLMKAELDFKQGNWQAPYTTMMEAARVTRDPRLAQRATEMALASRQGEPTLAAIRLWRELAPQSDEATQYYLGFVVLSDDITDAEAIFRARLSAATPGERGLLMFQTQQLLGRAKDKAAANAMLERLIAPYAATLEGRIVLAQAAFTRGDKERAQKEATAALALKPESEIAVLMVAQVTADESAAEALLARFIKANPNAREVRTAHARLLVNARKFGPAREELRVLLKTQPENLSTLYALGVVSLQLNDMAGAEGYLKRFATAATHQADTEADTGRAYSLLAQLADDRGDAKAALGWLDKIDEEDRVWFAAQLKRAQIVAKGGDVAGARKMLAALPAPTEAEQAQVLLADGQVLRDAARNDQAYTLLQAGVAKFPGNPDLLYDFAMMAEKTGHLDDMEKALREVMVQAPENHHAYNALGYSLAERNVRLPEALELIAKALQMAPDDPFIMDSMGWVQFRMGNLSAAEAQLRQAYALRSDPEIAVHLGEVLWQKGQQAAARKLWREARNKDPKNDTLRNTLSRLRTSM